MGFRFLSYGVCVFLCLVLSAGCSFLTRPQTLSADMTGTCKAPAMSIVEEEPFAVVVNVDDTGPYYVGDTVAVRASLVSLSDRPLLIGHGLPLITVEAFVGRRRVYPDDEPLTVLVGIEGRLLPNQPYGGRAFHDYGYDRDEASRGDRLKAVKYAVPLPVSGRYTIAATAWFSIRDESSVASGGNCRLNSATFLEVREPEKEDS